MKRKDSLETQYWQEEHCLVELISEGQCNSKIKKKQIAPAPISTLDFSNAEFVTEPQREVKILTKTDVLVIGRGSSGTTAAIAASKTSAETWLIEHYNHIGRLWTGGMVLQLYSTHAVELVLSSILSPLRMQSTLI